MARKATTPPVLPDLGLEDAYASLLMIEPRRASEIHPVLVEALAKRFTVEPPDPAPDDFLPGDGWLVPTNDEVAAWLALTDDERVRRINLAAEVQRLQRAGYTLMRGKGPIVIVRLDPVPADISASRTVHRLMSNAVGAWTSKLYRIVNGGSSGEAF